MFPKLLKLSILFVLLLAGYNIASASFTVSRPSTNNLGLVGHWTFDGADVTDKVYDKSGQGNHGYFYNGATTTAKVPGKIGQALRFDGVNDYVYKANSTPNGFYSATFGAWVKLDKNFSVKGTVVQNWGSNYDEVVLRVNADRTVGWVIDDNTANDNHIVVTSTEVLNKNQWYYVTGTWDGTNLYIYVNGVLNGTSSSGTGGRAGSVYTRIGGSSGLVNGGEFNGLIDDVRIYNRALSAGEVKSLYNQSASKFNKTPTNILTNGLVGHWTFDGADVTDKVYDKSGQGNHGYFYNGATTTAKVPGKIGQALRFDGVNDEVRIGDPADGSLDFGTSSFSLSFWMNTKTTIFNIPISKGTYGTPGYDIYSTPLSFVTLNLHLDGNFGGVNLSGAVPLNTWVHYAGVIDRTGGGFALSGYNNGTLYSTYATSTTKSLSNNRSLTFGNLSNGGGYPFNGLIDDIRIYNRALSAGEVKMLYNMGR